MKITSRRTLQSIAISACAVAGLSATASAQLINVDFNDPGGFGTTCSSTYAAAGTAGVWNGIDASLGINHPLVDKSGAATTATLNVGPNMVFPFSFVNANYAGDDANLMQDLVWSGGLNGGTMTITGLANGDYTLITYAMAPDNKVAGLTDVSSAQSTDPVQQVGGTAWPGNHALGISYSSHQVTVTTGQLDITAVFVAFGESINGFQLEVAETPPDTGSSFCAGDGSAGLCPCANFGGPGAGCTNSGGLGATLTATGAAGVGAADTLAFNITGVAGSKPGLLLRGNNQVNGGLGNPIGAGLICVGGASQRSQVQVTDASGSTTFSDWNGAGFGSVANSGVPTNFQFWYRDPQNSPCAGTDFNFSNAWTVTYP